MGLEDGDAPMSRGHLNSSHCKQIIFPWYESLIDTVEENRALVGVKRDERVFCFSPKFLRLPFHPASIILSLQLICSSKSHINTPPQCEADADGMLSHLFRSVPFNMQESSDGVNYSVSEQDRHLILVAPPLPSQDSASRPTVLTFGPSPSCQKKKEMLQKGRMLKNMRI